VGYQNNLLSINWVQFVLHNIGNYASQKRGT